MKRWPDVELGEVLKQDCSYVAEPEPRIYPKLSVKLYGRGAVLDSPVDGGSVKMRKHQIAKAGQVILSEIWAKKGAIGIVPPEGEGALCTSHFFLFDIDANRLDSGYMKWLLKGNFFEPQLDAKAQGTTGYAAIRPKHFLAAKIPLPPLAEQQAIVSRLDTLADKVRQVNERLDAIERDAGRLLANRYSYLCRDADRRKLGALLMPSTEYVALELDEEYEEITIRLWGKGIVSRGRLLGSQIRSARRALRENQLVFSKIDVRHGAIGIVPQDLAGAVVSNDFPSFDIDNSQITTEFLSYVVSSDEFINRCKEASSGTTNRVRLSEGTFLQLTVHLPSLENQRAFDALQAKVAALKARHATIRQANEALIPAMLERVFSGTN